MIKRYKILKLFTISIFILYVSMPLTHAENITENSINSHITHSYSHETSSIISDVPSINSRAAVVIDRNSNTVLYGKNENEKRKMASTTKIMTCLLVIENCNLSDTVEASKNAALTGGSRLGLKTGDKITVHDLLYGLMLCSGNDTAVALAEHTSGSVENFANLMNNRAKELGLKNTNFVTPHGLDKDEHYTTAYELALLANYALNNSTFAKIVSTKSYTVTLNGYPKTISNTNELLGNLNGVYGIKTGFTNGANRCLVTACKRDNLDIICIVLGADTKNFRTQDSIKLIEYTFNTFTPININQLINEKFEEWKINNLSDFEISKCQNPSINLKITPLENNIIPLKKDSVNNLEFFITCKKNLDAPQSKDTKLGMIEVYSNSSLITSTDILLDCNLDKKNIYDYFIYFFKIWSPT